MLAGLRASLRACAGDVVFGMEDGAVSIFGLVFGVAAITQDRRQVLVAGLTGAFAAAVSMMGGAYLEAETERDGGIGGARPLERAGWMLASDFIAAGLPIIPFVVLPLAEARWASLGLTVALLGLLGAGRARIGARRTVPTMLKTIAVGVAAALAGVFAGSLVAR